LVQGFKEIFEEVLEKVDPSGELHIDVAVVLQNQPGDMGNNEFIVCVPASMLKVTWIDCCEGIVVMIQHVTNRGR
jgi:hypothetical protein